MVSKKDKAQDAQNMMLFKIESDIDKKGIRGLDIIPYLNQHNLYQHLTDDTKAKLESWCMEREKAAPTPRNPRR